MRRLPYTFVLISFITSLLSTCVTSLSWANGDLSFFCGTSQETYATKVRTTTGDKPIIYYRNWAQGSGWTAQKRCQEVTQRFQQFHNQNRLKYLRVGYIHPHPVVCVTPSLQTSCLPQDILFTLEPGTNARTALNNLISLSKGNSSGGVSAYAYIGSQSSISSPLIQNDAQGNPYIDIRTLIQGN